VRKRDVEREKGSIKKDVTAREREGWGRGRERREEDSNRRREESE
jgi:hypothetical protein